MKRGDPLSVHPLLKGGLPDLPIAVPALVDFLFLVHYWPEQKARLYPVTVNNADTVSTLTRRLREACHLRHNREEIVSTFAAEHPAFILYSEAESYRLLTRLVASGAEVRSIQFDQFGRSLAEIHMRAQSAVPR